jgi:hypothetical protein
VYTLCIIAGKTMQGIVQHLGEVDYFSTYTLLYAIPLLYGFQKIQQLGVAGGERS